MVECFDQSCKMGQLGEDDLEVRALVAATIYVKKVWKGPVGDVLRPLNQSSIRKTGPAFAGGLRLT